MNKPVLEVQNLKKYFPIKSNVLKKKIGDIKAVNGVNLVLQEGENLGIVGESGCGKSTLGKAILGLEELTSGTIKFKGESIEGLRYSRLKKYKKDMQMIFQDPFASLNPRQRIGDGIEEIYKIHTYLSKQQRKERVKTLLKEVGLKNEHYFRYPHEFSGGQRQRIAIARAISLHPSLIVSDESTSALDVSVQAQIMNLLKSIQKKHQISFLFISHDLAVIRQMCERILIMYLGAMAEWGSAEKIYNNPLHPYTKILLSSIPKPDPESNKEYIPLKGDVPSASNYPNGCPFHTRCPIAKDHCSKLVPEWREIEEGHYVACHEV